uniref:Uncharacterized protein n=1 Tax=Arundo donax TaxID=35708 RepID=A0A0A8Z410_ARUDO
MFQCAFTHKKICILHAYILKAFASIWFLG